MGKRSYTLYKLSIVKQSLIRSENVMMVQDFLVTTGGHAVLKFLFFISFPQENLKEPEKNRKKKSSYRLPVLFLYWLNYQDSSEK